MPPTRGSVATAAQEGDARSTALGRGPVIARDDLDAFAANIEKIPTGPRTG